MDWQWNILSQMISSYISNIYFLIAEYTTFWTLVTHQQMKLDFVKDEVFGVCICYIIIICEEKTYSLVGPIKHVRTTRIPQIMTLAQWEDCRPHLETLCRLSNLDGRFNYSELTNDVPHLLRQIISEN